MKKDEIKAKKKDIYSFNFETKKAFLNGEELGIIESHTDTIVNVIWNNGIEQEFRLYTPIKNITKFDA